jgi:micrococcal nuclease
MERWGRVSNNGWVFRAELVRVIDGDTVVMNVDLGFGIKSVHPVRIAGVNCPEHGTPEGTTATEFTTAWFANNGTNGVELVTVKGKETEKYGRYLAFVYADYRTKSLGDALLLSGNAKVYPVN